jgi:hypothetical protein
MIVDNGERQRLIIPGVFDGLAGVARGRVAFVPNQDRIEPGKAKVGVLNDEAVRLSPRREPVGPFWTSTYEVMK